MAYRQFCKYAALCGSALSALMAAPAFSQTTLPTDAPDRARATSGSGPRAEDPNAQLAGVQDIVVTAQRKSESLRKVPISVNVITRDALVQCGITGSEALPSAAPGLTFARQGGGPKLLKGRDTRSSRRQEKGWSKL